MAGPAEDNQEQIIKEAVRCFIDARWQGQEPNIDEFVRQYPGLERQIKQGIQNAQRIDVLFDSLVRTNERDFEDAATGHALIGRKVGTFEIVEMIGRGGMGVVYLARDTKLKRSVAIKSVPAQLAAAPTDRMRFRREAELLASLNHPNIAVIHDIIEEDKSGYLILEYVPGETLAERIAREPLKLQEALSISQQIAEAVSAAHEKGVVHCDLKPGNIKIMPDGRVKVLDFGLAKASASEGKPAETTVTQPGRVIGTPAYMSPEQAHGKDIDHRTDIWSFGCITYQMLTGQVPFEGQTAADTLACILEREPNWEVLPKDTPTNIRVLLRRCLEKEPSHRLQHIENAAIEISQTISKPAAATVSSKSQKMAMTIGAIIIIILSVIAVRFIPEQQAQPSTMEIRLAVLPFENLGSAENEYFADGITEEIMSRLSAIHKLGVISRSSAIQYKNSNKTIKKIGEELGVEYVLEGTVRWERLSEGSSRVRVTPQLIRVSDDTHLWSDRYDAVLADIFDVQSKIAEQVAQALDIALLTVERQALMSKPTLNIEAYEQYLRGNEYFYRSYLKDDFLIAIRMYDKAVELDPTFVLGYVQLSRAHVDMYWFHYDRSEERLAMAKQAVDKAFEFDPDLPEVRLALGWYYYHGDLDFGRALEQFTIASKTQPNNSDLLKAISFVQRRLGKFELALANLKKASELDPLSNVVAFELAQTFMFLRMYPQADRYYNRAISLSPDFPEPYSWHAWSYLLWEGNTEKARAVFEQASQNSDSLEDHWIVFRFVVLNIFEGDYQKALSQLSSWTSEAFEPQFYFVPKAQLYAQINGLMGNKKLEQAYYESARSILETKIQEQPKDARFHSALGIAYAGLGRKQDAIREGQLAVELLPVSEEALRGFYRAKDLAQIYATIGEHDAAIDQLEFLLSKPGEMSIPLLRLDPAWNPLRDHPRLKKLVESGK